MNPELQKAIEEDSLVLFVGAGMSMSLGFPNWNNLVEQILNRLKAEYPSGTSPIDFPYYINALKSGSKNVLDILEVIDNGGYKKEVKTMLYEIIKGIDYEEDELINQKKLWEISDKIITTNYDKVLNEIKPKGIEVFANDNFFQQVQSIKGKPFLYKIHGDITNPDTCILFKSDYEDLYKGDKSNTQTLRNFLQNKTLLFLGFSLEDPYITSQIEYLYDLYSGYGGNHFIVQTSPKDFTRYNVKTIQVDDWYEGFDSFLDKLIEFKKNTRTCLRIGIIQ